MFGLVNSHTPVVVAPTARIGDAMPARLKAPRYHRPHHVHRGLSGLQLKQAEHHHHAKRVQGQKPKRRKGASTTSSASDSDSEWDTETSDSEESGDDAKSGGAGGDDDGKDDHACTVASFSMDGLLVATGFDNRTLLVLDAAHPQEYPVAKFVAYGAVSAVAMGHGLRAWPGVDPNAHEVGGTALNGGKDPVVGSGDGRIGVVVAGDNTGAVFVLTVSDVVQAAIHAQLEAARSGEEEAESVPDTGKAAGSDSGQEDATAGSLGSGLDRDRGGKWGGGGGLRCSSWRSVRAALMYTPVCFACRTPVDVGQFTFENGKTAVVVHAKRVLVGCRLVAPAPPLETVDVLRPLALLLLSCIRPATTKRTLAWQKTLRGLYRLMSTSWCRMSCR